MLNKQTINKGKRYLYLLISILLINLVISIIDSVGINIEFEHNLSIDKPMVGELYYRSLGNYNEDDKISFQYDKRDINLTIPLFYAKSIRLDPLIKRGEILIKNIKFNGKKFNIQNLDLSRNYHDVNISISDKNTLLIKSFSNNPYFNIGNNIYGEINFDFNSFKAVLVKSLKIFLVIVILLNLKLLVSLIFEKIEYNNIFKNTLALVLILFVLDIYIRGFQVYNSFISSIYYYLLNFGIVFTFYFLLLLFIELFRNIFLKKVLVVIIAILLSSIYIFQYSIYSLYKQFATFEVINTVIVDFDYWLKNSSNIISLSTIFYFIMLFILFYLFLSKKITKYINFRPHILLYIFIIIWIFLGNLYFHSLVSERKSVLLPIRSLIIKASYYIKNRDKLKPSGKFNRKIIKLQKVEKPKYNILLLINESLRNDHLNLYGYKKNTSLNISSFFKDSYIYKAISQTAVTPTALEAIFTGLYPSHYSDGAPTLWQYAKKIGYQTFYFGSQTLNWSGGLDRYFLEKKYLDKIYSPITSNSAVGHDDSLTISAFNKYIKHIKNKGYFFGAIHFNSTHFPYIEHPKSDKFFPISHSIDLTKVVGLNNAYDNAIYYMDKQFKKMVDGLKKNNMLDNTIIIFFSDHAEAFGEHNELFHTNVFWIEAIRTPLMIYIPENLKKKMDRSNLKNLMKNTRRYTANINIFSTVLDLLNLKPETRVDSLSLLNSKHKRYIFSTKTPNDVKFVYIDRVKELKFMFDNDLHKLYISDLSRDPAEKNFRIRELSKSVDRKEALELIKIIEKEIR